MAGTAAVTGAVESLRIRGKNYDMKVDDSTAKFSVNAKKYLQDIQYGRLQHEYSYLIE